ncbi:hypothetical protein IT409_00680 [Candidatus Falkowbacteria bacterium]|nr:hypothetical protein [Candidatus Falkowbacteria bacterium]
MQTFSQRMKEYSQLLIDSKYPLGDWKNGEIQIINDVDVIGDYESRNGVINLMGKYIPQSPSPHQIGIIEQDQYIYTVRDLVYFPPKNSDSQPRIGTYRRIMYRWELQGNLGVLILPIDHEGNLILNLTYRHSLRSFSCDAPGTISKEGETINQTIERCINFELNRPILESSLITSSFIAERGIFSGPVPMYLVRVGDPRGSHEDQTVIGHISLSPKAFETHLLRGYMFHDGRQYSFNDGYTNTAYFLAKLKNLF